MAFAQIVTQYFFEHAWFEAGRPGVTPGETHVSVSSPGGSTETDTGRSPR